VGGRRPKRRRVVVALAVGVPLLGLAAIALVAYRSFTVYSAVDDRAATLVWQGRPRAYHVYRPPGVTGGGTVPLVLALHGSGGTGLGMDPLTGGTLSAEAGRRGWLLVCPDGIAKGWNDGRLPAGARDRAKAGVDDVGFLSALIDRMVTDENADPSRVYVAGISNGGFMALRLALERSERIAAVAAVAAGVPRVLAERRPARPVSVLLVNGTEDRRIPYRGGWMQTLGGSRGEVLSAPEGARWWAERNGCVGPPKLRELPDRDPGDATRVTLETHAPCGSGTEVALYRVDGGGHTWPNGRQYAPRFLVGRITHDLDGTRAIFDFFARHART
jgi:polyhydroxybutyrate depolymerase